MLGVVALVGAFCASSLPAQGYSAKECPSCAEWNAPHAPVKVFGNSYYVGTTGLSAILITSPAGHVLIDGGLPESAPHILRNITTLGFRLEDVKLILNSHDHYDHAGGIAAIAKATGAAVVVSASSAKTLRAGASGPEDPQFAIALPFPKVSNVRVVADGDTLRLGPIHMITHFTPGHTAGGTTWRWRSCEGMRCLDMVYADSQTPISDDTFRYTGDPRYPSALADYARGHALLEQIPCDILLTPHPGASSMWERLASAATGGAPGLIDREGCRRYAAAGRVALAKRIARERAGS